MPTFKKNPDAEPAFYLKSGNSPLFKMMGSSSPAKKLSLEGLKEGFKKLQTKVKTWKEDPKNKKKVEAIETAGDALSAAGESLASSGATTAEEVVMESAPPPSPQSTVAPDVTKLIASKDIKLQPPPEGPKGPMVKRSPTKFGEQFLGVGRGRRGGGSVMDPMAPNPQVDVGLTDVSRQVPLDKSPPIYKKSPTKRYKKKKGSTMGSYPSMRKIKK